MTDDQFCGQAALELFRLFVPGAIGANLHDSTNHGFFSAADELTTSLRVDRHPSRVVVSSTRRSQERNRSGGTRRFNVDGLNRSYISTDLNQIVRNYWIF